MGILVQPHWLHPIQAVHDFQAMEPNYTVLQLKKKRSTSKLAFKYLQLLSKTLLYEEQKVYPNLAVKKFFTSVTHTNCILLHSSYNGILGCDTMIQSGKLAAVFWKKYVLHL